MASNPPPVRKPAAATTTQREHILEMEAFLRSGSLNFMGELITSRPASPASHADYMSINSDDHEREASFLTPLHLESSNSGENLPSVSENLNQEEKTTDLIKSGRAWRAGSLKLFPWVGLFSLIGAFLCAAAALVVLWISNNQTADWKVEPSVLIAVITPLANILLGIALHRGSKISWWAAAIKGCTVNELSRKYDFSDGFFDSICAGRYIDWTAIAKVMAGIVVLDGPLLQRASTITPQNFTQNITLSTRIATTVESFSSAGFVSCYPDAFGDPTLLSPAMVKVMQDYGNRAQITMDISGCTGTCFATIEAAGISHTCHTDSDSTGVFYNNGAGNSTTLFQSGFNKMNYHTHNDFNWTITYSNTTNGPPQRGQDGEDQSFGDCLGTAITTNCQLEHAVVRYPVLVQNSTVTLLQSSLPLEVVSTELVGEVSIIYNDDDDDDDDGSLAYLDERVFTGLSLALSNLYTASATTKSGGKYGYFLNMTGSLASNYFLNGTSTSCAFQFGDPTSDVLSALNEIMFRISVSAVSFAENASSIPAVNVTAQQTSIKNAYQSHFSYMTAALVLMVIGALSILPTFGGWWTLGRPVTLNPIETAKAFNAPIFAGPELSNSTLKELLQMFGEKAVKYGEVEVVDNSSDLDGGQVQLEISSSASVLSPRSGTIFGNTRD